MPDKKKTYRVVITQELELEASSIEELSSEVESEVSRMLQWGEGLDYEWFDTENEE